MKTTGRTILITGGSTGIGLAFAAKFLELGNEVIVTGRRESKLAEAKAKYPKLHTIVSDASDPAAISALAAEVCARFPALDVLMNNAGIMVNRNLAASGADLAALTTEIDINFVGLVRTTAAFMDQMKKTKGTIINVSSGLAWVPLPSSPIYCATKAAVHSYTLSLRFHLQDAGVEVIELAPPAVKTELSDIPPDANVTIISTDDLVSMTMKSIAAGEVEIRPGQANQLYWMSRVAPGFINGQLAKASKGMIPTN